MKTVVFNSLHADVKIMSRNPSCSLIQLISKHFLFYLVCNFVCVCVCGGGGGGGNRILLCILQIRIIIIKILIIMSRKKNGYIHAKVFVTYSRKCTWFLLIISVTDCRE